MKNILWMLPLCCCLAFVVLAADTTPDKKAHAKEGETTEANKETATPASPKAGEGGGAPAAKDVEQTYFDAFIDKVTKGGYTMLFLLALSVAGISLICERLVNLRASTFISRGLVEKANRLYRNEQYTELKEVCRKDKSILARIVLAVVDHRACETRDIQGIADDIGSREVRCQMQKAYPLAIIATISPLLGLFGTVIGMIGAFDTVSAVGEMGNASLMAGDIAKALVTTAGGLVVAMPMLGFYHWFRTRTSRYAISLEEDMAELFSAWFLKKDASIQTTPAVGIQAEPAITGDKKCVSKPMTVTT